jgi:hypothetical protein
MLTQDRRVFQRLRLAKPILGMLDGQNALLLDLGVTGAFVEHYGTTTAHAKVRLQFRWQNEDIEFVCVVVRTDVVRRSGSDALSHTGLRFIDAVGDSEARLYDLMAAFVGTVLAAQKANANAVPEEATGLPLADIGAARRTRMKGLVSYRLAPNRSWWRASTTDTKQPVDGFTVAAYEHESDLEVLCRTYEAADEEGRQLIRLVAELSVLSVTNS